MADPLNANPTFDPNLPVDPNTPIDKNAPATPGDSNVSPISDDSNIQGGAGTVTPPSMPVDDSTVKPVEPPVAVAGTEPSLNPLDDSSQTGGGIPVDQGVPSTSGTPSDTGTQPPIVPDTNIPPVSEVVQPPDTTSTPPVSPTDTSGTQVQPPADNVPSNVPSGTDFTPSQPGITPTPEPVLPGQPGDTTGIPGGVSPTGEDTGTQPDDLKKNTNL